MFTIFVVVVVLMVPLAIAALGFQFKETDEVYHREWTLYQQQNYD